jgi:hypothetical protein
MDHPPSLEAQRCIARFITARCSALKSQEYRPDAGRPASGFCNLEAIVER